MVSHKNNGDDVANPAPKLHGDAPSSDLAISIEADFRALVDILSKASGGPDALEGELLDHLRRAREAAEQGLRLSQRLVRMAQLAGEGERA